MAPATGPAPARPPVLRAFVDGGYAECSGLSWVNAWFLRDLRSPFGGVGCSGIGREGGEHSLDFYSALTNVCVAI
jgi:hypothetical protein